MISSYLSSEVRWQDCKLGAEGVDGGREEESAGAEPSDDQTTGRRQSWMSVLSAMSVILVV